MNSSRRVAVLGGIRIPFARQNGPYAQASNQDMLTATLDANRSKSNAQRLKALAKVRPQHIVPQIPRNAEPRTGLSMGEHQAITTKEWGIGREEQDEVAVASHRNLAAAYDTGFQDDLVV